MTWFDFAFDIFIYCKNFINSFILLPLPSTEIILRNKTKKIKLFPYVKTIIVDLHEVENTELENIVSDIVSDIVKTISIEVDVHHAEYTENINLFDMIIEKYNEIQNSTEDSCINKISIIIDKELTLKK